MQTIDFYFDFSSPYGYFSSTRIDAIAARHNRTVTWRPYLMGAVMKLTERKPLIQIPMISDYSARDLARAARLSNIDFQLPTRFPIATVAACRAFYWLNERNETQARQLAQALFRAYFVSDEPISDPETVADLTTGIGIDSAEVAKALVDSRIKQLVRDATDNAIANKVFGSPFIVVDGEPFWGHDRLDQVDKWLETGGW